MINIRRLIDFLPFYFKDKDTYKVDGKGILERFLEICGDYFTDNIKSVVDNSLDIIDLESNSQQYLAFIWELLGQIPFAQKPEVKPLKLTEEQQRYLIKYSNELLKIRGTKEFFEIMFRIYSNDTNNLKLESIEISDGQFEWEKDRFNHSDKLLPYLDYDNLDDPTIRFDEYYRMKQCVDVIFRLTGTFDNSEIESARKSLTAFVNRFVPYNANPIVYLNGLLEDSKYYKIIVEIFWEGKWGTPVGELDLYQYGGSLPVRVYLVKTSDQKDTLGEYLPLEGIEFTSQINDGREVSRENIYEFTIDNIYSDTKKPGDDYIYDTYTFRYHGITKYPGDDQVEIKVYRSRSIDTYRYYHLEVVNKQPPYEYDLRDDEGNIIPIKIQLRPYYTQGVNIVPTRVQLYNTSTIQTPDSNGLTEWTLDKPGEYLFELVDKPTVRVIITVNDDFESTYQVTLAQNSKPVPPDDGYTDKLSISTQSLKDIFVAIKVTSNDPEADRESLACRLYGTNKVYYDGDIFIPNGYGTYTFEPVKGGGDATLTLVSGLVNFSTYILSTSPSDLTITEDISEVKLLIQANPTTPSAQELAKDGLDWCLQLPYTSEGESEVVTLIYNNGSYEIEGYGTLEVVDLTKLSITLSTPGVYRVWPRVKPEAFLEFQVNSDIKIVYVPTDLIIVPEDESSQWSGGDSSNATFQIEEGKDLATFSLELVDQDGKSVFTTNKASENDSDNNIVIGSTLSKSDPGVYKYTLVVDEGTFEATLTIKDYESVITLSCLPSVSSIVNVGEVTTKLSIKSNKPKDVLQIKHLDTGDLYQDGDVFTAKTAGEYIFIAVVNGVEDPNITTKFTVIDLNQVGVSPEVIEFDADGNPLTDSSIQIVADPATEWVLSIE